MRAVLGLVGLMALVQGGASLAQTRHYDVTVRPAASQDRGFQKITVSKAVIGDAQIVLWGGAAIDPDCSAHPGSTLTVVQPPSHGAVKVVDEPMYVAFPPQNPRSACNSRQVTGHKAYYTANPGYSGHDKVVLEGSSEDGHIRHVTVDVDVRKSAASG
jgi:hypothetical protein